MTESSKGPNSIGGAAPFNTRHMSLLWALQSHAGEIARLHGAIFPEPWDEASVLQLLGHPGSIALIAAQGNPSEVGGFALARIAADEAEILSLGVAAAWRRHGVGLQLVGGIKRAALRGGARSLFLEVADSNMAARTLYAKGGFFEAARRPGYYQRAGAAAEDALVLRADLSA